MTAPNPNWPVHDEAVSFPARVGDPTPFPYWLSLGARSYGPTSVRRGRQYELDQQQAGEYAVCYRNRDGALSPENPSSPYYPAVKPFKPIRLREQWPITPNMLTVDQATGGQVGYPQGVTLSAAPGLQVTSPVSTAATAKPVADAWQGGNVFSTTVPSGTAAGTVVWLVVGATMVAGWPHSFQVQARANAAMPVAARLMWVDATGATLTTTTGPTVTLPASRAWQQLTVSDTPPARAAGLAMQVVNTAATAAAVVCDIDGLQLEYAAAPTPYQQPGTWYPMFAGFVERWPSTWTDAGTYTYTSPTIVDGFAYLSQQLLPPPFYLDALYLTPDFFYPLDQGAGAIVVPDRTGNNPPGLVTNSIYGPGSLTFGNGLESSDGIDDTRKLGAPQGVPEAVATFNNPNGVYAPDGNNMPGTYIDFSSAGGVTPAAASFSRVITFRVPAAPPKTDIILYSVLPPTFAVTTSQNLTFGVTGVHTTGVVQCGSQIVYPPWTVADGNWHMLVINFSSTARTVTLWFDGATLTLNTGYLYGPWLTEVLGMGIAIGANQYFGGFIGDIGCFAGWNRLLSNNEMSYLYESWRIAWANDDTSFQRYSRICRWAGLGGAPAFLGSPSTAQMGPASDISQGTGARGSGQNGIDVISALEGTVQTEAGNHFIAASGQLTMESRSWRYGTTAPTVTFGEQAGEVPYEDVELDFDVTRVINNAQVTQYVNNSVHEQFAPASQLAYGTRTATRQINTMNNYEPDDCASYLTYRYAEPFQRVSKLRLHPSAIPQWWQTLLALEQGTRARVMRRPPGGTAPIQIDGHVDQMEWTRDKTEVFLDLQISPNTRLQFWQFSALHTTLNAAVAAGATSVVLNALASAATTPFSLYVSTHYYLNWGSQLTAPTQVPGMRLTLDPGTAVQETVAITAVTGGQVGYSTVQLGLPSTTLATSSSAGTNYLTITDGSAFYKGDTVRITDAGGATETVVVSSVLPGYNAIFMYLAGTTIRAHNTGTVLQAVTAYPHAAGALVAEPFTGTDPTVWDASAVLEQSTIVGY